MFRSRSERVKTGVARPTRIAQPRGVSGHHCDLTSHLDPVASPPVDLESGVSAVILNRLSLGDAEDGGLSWSPDGSWIALAHQPGRTRGPEPRGRHGPGDRLHAGRQVHARTERCRTTYFWIPTIEPITGPLLMPTRHREDDAAGRPHAYRAIGWIQASDWQIPGRSPGRTTPSGVRQTQRYSAARSSPRPRMPTYVEPQVTRTLALPFSSR